MEYQKSGKNQNGRKQCISKKISGWNRRRNSQVIQQISSMKRFECPNVFYTVRTVSNRIITRSLLLSLQSFMVSKRESNCLLNFSPEFGDIFCFK